MLAWQDIFLHDLATNGTVNPHFSASFRSFAASGPTLPDTHYATYGDRVYQNLKQINSVSLDSLRLEPRGRTRSRNLGKIQNQIRNKNTKTHREELPTERIDQDPDPHWLRKAEHNRIIVDHLGKEGLVITPILLDIEKM
jgi:hypothetical protein